MLNHYQLYCNMLVQASAWSLEDVTSLVRIIETTRWLKREEKTRLLERLSEMKGARQPVTSVDLEPS